MKVIVPYANDVSEPDVHQRVRDNLAELGIDAEFIRMHEPNDYSLLIIRLWEEGERFVLVEHDVLPWAGCVEEVWNCPEPFCGFDGSLQVAKLDVPRLGDCPVNPLTPWFMMDGDLHRGLWEREPRIGFHDHVFFGPMPVHLKPAAPIDRHNMRADGRG